MVSSRADAKQHGLKRYFTGAACPRGHVAERFTSSGGCVVCCAERDAQSRVADPDRHNAKAKRSYAKHPEKRRAASRTYRVENPHRVKASKFDYQQRRGEHLLEKAREYKQREAARLKEWSAAYKRENKGRINAANRARVAHIKRATPPWADLSAIEQMYVQAAESGMHVDHVIPLRGKFVSGLHVESNLQLLPPVENHRKYNKVAPT